MNYLLDDMRKTAAKKVKFNIDDYMRGDDLARDRIAHGVRYREIKKADLKDLFKDPRAEAVRIGTSYGKKIPKKDWTKEHLGTLPYAAVAESFNDDYLNYLGDVADHVHKKQQQRRGLGAAAGVGAAAGGAYLYNRYKKKKRAQAEQEKMAAWAFGKNRYIPRTLDDDTLRERMRFTTHVGDVLTRGIERFEDLDPEENRTLFEKNLRLKRAERAAKLSKERRQAINILSGMAAVPPTLIGLAGVYEGQRAGNRELVRKGAAIAATSSALPLGIAAYRFKKKHYDSQKPEAIAKDQEERRKDSDAAADYFRMKRLVDAHQRSKKE